MLKENIYQDLSNSKKDTGEVIRYTSCSMNGCFSDPCVLKVHIKDGKVTRIEPDDTINPGNPREDIGDEKIRQSLIQLRACPQGYAQVKELNAPDRVLYPMKQVGKRGEGQFVRISWEEALDTIAEKIKYVKEKYGPNSIYHTAYTGYKNGFRGFILGPWYQAGVDATRGISFGGCEVPEEFWLGIDVCDLFTGSPNGVPTGFEAPDLFNSNLIVLWGWNPIAGSYHTVPYYLKLARERGIPIICIEPRYSWSAELLADQWIPIRPSTDLAMMLAVADVLLRQDLYDKEYVQKWVDLEGFEKFKAYILGDEDGVEKTPEWAEAICGVPAETIVEFARLYARSKPVHLQFWIGPSKQHRGEYNTAMALLLQALTGNLTIPGGAEPGCSFGNMPHVFGPQVDWQKAPWDFPGVFTVTGLKWAEAILLRKDFESGKITKEEYYRRIGNHPDNPAPNIQMVIVDNNPLNNFHHINKRIQAMQKVEFTWGWQWHTSQITMRFLDIVLPGPITAFETTDVPNPIVPHTRFGTAMTGNANYFTYQQKCVNPPGEIRPKMWAWTEIANRLGIGEKFNPLMKDVPYEQWDDCVEDIHRKAYEAWAASPQTLAMVGEAPTWEEFMKKPILRVPIDVPHYPFKEYMEAGLNPFRTPTGKIEFYSNRAANTDWSKSEYTGQLDPLPRWEPSYMPGPAYDSFFHPKAEKYPLLMITPVSTYRAHSSSDSNPLLRDDIYRHAIWINIADAKARNICDGDAVRVYSDVGEILMPAYVTSRTTPGVVVIHHGAWYTPSSVKTDLMPLGVDTRGAPNSLIGDEHLPHLVGSMLNSGLVQVEKFMDVEA